jgi:hypothetical protein
MRTVIKAQNGCILTNGEIYGRTVYLAEGADASAFYEITDEEFAAMEEDAEPVEMADESDYTAALERFGVQ